MSMGFDETPGSRWRRLQMDKQYEERQAERERLLAARRLHPRRRNAQGHVYDCVCRTCFEAWLRDDRKLREDYVRAMRLLGQAA